MSKVDCGFDRLGVPMKEAHGFVISVARNPRMEIAGLYTHLPFASEVTSAAILTDFSSSFGMANIITSAPTTGMKTARLKAH